MMNSIEQKNVQALQTYHFPADPNSCRHEDTNEFPKIGFVS